MRSAIVAAVLCSAAMVVPMLAAEKDLPTGTWVGRWIREGSAVDVTMRISKSRQGYEGSFDSEGLRVAGIPMQKVIWAKPELRWEVRSDSGLETYRGQVRRGTLSGEFTQGEARGRFSFLRSSRASPPPKREEITFESGEVVLAGTIFVPAGAGPHPGIVFLHGSGAEGRWASNYLALRFARGGFAALAFDKRGVGQSGGDWQTAGFDELASDAAAAVSALSAKPYVAPGKVGIHGHSQGGTLAPLAAVRIGHPAFIIASAGSGLSMRETETFSVENSLGVNNLPPIEAEEARAFVKAITATAFEGQPYEKAVEAWRNIQRRPWAFDLPSSSHSYWRFCGKIAGYDATTYWRLVSAPTLLAYGEKDERVPPRPSSARIAEAYLNGSGTSFQLRFFPGADHTFRLPPDPGGAFSWPRTATGYPEALIDWAAGVVGLASGEGEGRKPSGGTHRQH